MRAGPRPRPEGLAVALRVALLGAGRHGGGRLLPALEALDREGLVEIAAIAVRSEVRAADIERRFPGRVRIGWEAAVAEPLVEAVVVALPERLLARAAAAARAAGRHVLCETPGAATRADLRRLRSTERPGAPVLRFASPVRFAPAYAGPVGPEIEHHSLHHACDLAVWKFGSAACASGAVRIRVRPGAGAAGDPDVEAEVRAFVAAVRGEASPLPDLATLEAVVRLAWAVRRARRWDRLRALLRLYITRR